MVQLSQEIMEVFLKWKVQACSAEIQSYFLGDQVHKQSPSMSIVKNPQPRGLPSGSPHRCSDHSQLVQHIWECLMHCIVLALLPFSDLHWFILVHPSKKPGSLRAQDNPDKGVEVLGMTPGRGQGFLKLKKPFLVVAFGGLFASHAQPTVVSPLLKHWSIVLPVLPVLSTSHSGLWSWPCSDGLWSNGHSLFLLQLDVEHLDNRVCMS